jgi:hypothetical protein
VGVGRKWRAGRVNDRGTCEREKRCAPLPAVKDFLFLVAAVLLFILCLVLLVRWCGCDRVARSYDPESLHASIPSLMASVTFLFFLFFAASTTAATRLCTSFHLLQTPNTTNRLPSLLRTSFPSDPHHHPRRRPPAPVLVSWSTCLLRWAGRRFRFPASRMSGIVR